MVEGQPSSGSKGVRPELDSAVVPSWPTVRVQGLRHCVCPRQALVAAELRRELRRSSVVRGGSTVVVWRSYRRCQLREYNHVHAPVACIAFTPRDDKAARRHAARIGDGRPTMMYHLGDIPPDGDPGLRGRSRSDGADTSMRELGRRVSLGRVQNEVDPFLGLRYSVRPAKLGSYGFRVYIPLSVRRG